MATGGSVIDSVLLELQESTSSPIFWSRVELLQYLNDGMQELNLLVGKTQSSQTFNVPATTTIHSVPSGSITVLHLSQDNIMVRKREIEHMDRESRKWMKYTSPKIKSWGLIGLNLFYVSPQWVGPSTTPVTLVTFDIPATIGEGTTIALDEEYVDALEFYTYHMARFKEGGPEFEQSMDAYQRFIERVGQLAGRILSQQDSFWSKSPAADTGPRYGTLPRS